MVSLAPNLVSRWLHAVEQFGMEGDVGGNGTGDSGGENVAARKGRFLKAAARGEWHVRSGQFLLSLAFLLVVHRSR